MSLLFVGLIVFLLLVVVGRFSNADPNRATRLLRGVRRSLGAYFDRGNARRREHPQGNAAGRRQRGGIASGEK